MDASVVVDVAVFVVFIAAVIAVGILMSRHEEDSESYFLAGRGLKWWLIGFSLIAANISAEQFVGMSGQAAKDSIGLAVASYEWIAAVTLVVVAFFFLPTFLRSGIFTIPEFLEYRYNHFARTIMSALMVIIYVGVTIATVIFLGAKALDPLFTGSVLGIPMDVRTLSWIVGVVAAVYVAAGGLKACAWADLIQGSALIVGGAVIMVLAFMALDRPGDFEGIDAAAVHQRLDVGEDASFAEKFQELKSEKMHMVLPRSSTFLPWTALLLGIWIPNFYYWGLNQYIMQRTLGARSLAHGQKGVVFAAALKLIIPFVVCIPGIIAFTLYAEKMQENAMEGDQLNKPVLEALAAAKADPAGAAKLFPFDADFASLHPQLARDALTVNAGAAGVGVPSGDDLMEQNSKLIAEATKADSSLAVSQELVGYDYDGAFPLLIRYLTPAGPPGLRGFVLAALMGAVISSLASMLNAASTIFTMDIYREYINRNASQKTLVWVGRACVPVCVVIGCLIAPQLANPKFRGAFAYIQEFQGYVSPGVLTIFLFGLFVPRSPRACGVVGLVLSPVIYGFLHLFYGDMAFLNRMAITVGALAVVLAVMTILRPLQEPVTLPKQEKIELKSSRGAVIFGIVVVLATAALYVIFW
jgi:SSS family solute:Na+ symporter